MNPVVKQFGYMFASFARSFICAGIAVILAAGTGVLDMGVTDWQIAGNAAIAAGLLTLYKALDPTQQSYGIGSMM